MIVLAVLAEASVSHSETFVVTTLDDSGPGSLRWAIEQSNATPGRDEIFGGSMCDGPCAIVPLSALPPITDPVTITYIPIDGAKAGPADGLVIAADHVEMESVTVTNFAGDGIVIYGQGAFLDSVSATANRNGIRVEGSWGFIEGSTFVSNREAGVWLTQQSTHNQIGMPMFACPYECPIVGPNQVAGNNKGIWVEGTLNVIDSNEVGTPSLPNFTGIVVSGAHNAVINCSVSHNTGDGVFLGAPARFENNSGSCNGGRFVSGAVISPPSITFAQVDPTVITARGEFHGEPNAQYKLELHEVPTCADQTPAWVIGSILIATDATGLGIWRAELASYVPVTRVFAMANRTDHEETSGTSETFALFVTGERNVDLAVETTGPATASTGEEIEFVTTVKNNGPAAIATFVLDLPKTEGTAYASPPVTHYCSNGEQCAQIGVLGAGESGMIRERVLVTAGSGTLRHVATVSVPSYIASSCVDPQPTNNTATTTVNVSAAVPALSPVGLLLLSAALAAAGIFVRR